MSYKYFCNKKCQFYPCHNIEDLNCLFCFCPLYPYDDCGGEYFINKKRIKDCSKCLLPHDIENYDYIIAFLLEKTEPFL